MPATLHAFLRYQTIDECLQRVKTGVKYNAQRLREECGKALSEQRGIEKIPSIRSLRYDLDEMKSGRLGYEAPIVYNRMDKTYEYSDSNFSIKTQPVSEVDLKELGQMLTILKQFSGYSNLTALQEAVTRLDYAIGEQGPEEKQVIHYGYDTVSKGKEWMDKIIDAIKSQSAITLTYKPFEDDDPAPYLFSPHMLKEYNNRWYTFGRYHEVEDKVFNFPLDRIIDIISSSHPYKVIPDFNPKEHFKNIIGVTKNEEEEIEYIRIKAFGTQANYIQTKPIHPTQVRVQEKDDYSIFVYDIRPNFELEKTLLAFGELIEVLEPESLRQKMTDRIKKMKALYK